MQHGAHITQTQKYVFFFNNIVFVFYLRKLIDNFHIMFLFLSFMFGYVCVYVQFIIMVIDSTDRERLAVTREELYRMLQHEDLSKASLLVYANKQVFIQNTCIIFFLEYILYN